MQLRSIINFHESDQITMPIIFGHKKKCLILDPAFLLKWWVIIKTMGFLSQILSGNSSEGHIQSGYLEMKQARRYYYRFKWKCLPRETQNMNGKSILGLAYCEKIKSSRPTFYLQYPLLLSFHLVTGPPWPRTCPDTESTHRRYWRIEMKPFIRLVIRWEIKYNLPIEIIFISKIPIHISFSIPVNNQGRREQSRELGAYRHRIKGNWTFVFTKTMSLFLTDGSCFATRNSFVAHRSKKRSQFVEEVFFT